MANSRADEMFFAGLDVYWDRGPTALFDFIISLPKEDQIVFFELWDKYDHGVDGRLDLLEKYLEHRYPDEPESEIKKHLVLTRHSEKFPLPQGKPYAGKRRVIKSVWGIRFFRPGQARRAEDEYPAIVTYN